MTEISKHWTTSTHKSREPSYGNGVEEVLKEMLTDFIRPETNKDDRTYPPTLNFRLNQKYMSDIKFFDQNSRFHFKKKISFRLSNILTNYIALAALKALVDWRSM